MQILDPIREKHIDESDLRKEEKPSTIWSFLICIFIYFFTIESSEVIYSTYIYDYARCSENLGLTSSDGAILASASTDRTVALWDANRGLWRNSQFLQ